MSTQTNDAPVIIKKYANRRLYDTDTSAYVTLDDLCVMVKKGVDFVVQDAKTGEDLTRQILAQIIFEQESHGQHLLPISFLRSVIGYYDNKMQEFLPHYLEASMESFSKNQEKMQEYARGAMGNFASPFSQFEELGKQNMALFQKAFQMFSPPSMFGNRGEEEKRSSESAEKKKRADGGA